MLSLNTLRERRKRCAVAPSGRMAMTSDHDRPPDDELLARVAAGDADAFGDLFGRHKGLVYRFALHMCGSPAAADDVTQDVFLTVMRDAGRYERGRSGVTAWLCGIARNHARRRLDQDRARVAPADWLNDEEIEARSAGADPLEELTRTEQIEAVRRAVLSLPVRYREVIVLCDLEELSYTDAAAIVGCAVGTVRSRLHRGRALLLAKLAAAYVGCTT